MIKINDSKCAPGVKYENGSCLSEANLKYIAKKYNEKYNENIDINLSKKELVKKLDNVFKPKCNDQLCWANEVKLHAFRQQILKEKFRPFGPSDKFEWLSRSSGK